MKWLAEFPSTNGRIVWSLVIVGFTALRYLVWGEPGAEWAWGLWLGFLAASLGLDYAQFKAKRESWKPSLPAQPDVEDAVAGAQVPHSAPEPARPATIHDEPMPPLTPDD